MRLLRDLGSGALLQLECVDPLPLVLVCSGTGTGSACVCFWPAPLEDDLSFSSVRPSPSSCGFPRGNVQTGPGGVLGVAPDNSPCMLPCGPLVCPEVVYSSLPLRLLLSSCCVFSVSSSASLFFPLRPLGSSPWAPRSSSGPFGPPGLPFGPHWAPLWFLWCLRPSRRD